MPEGDTIHRSANRLAAAITGEAVQRVATPRRAGAVPRRGATVERVWAEGKYLMISFDDGLVLETHMKMNGSWHLYRPGERWRRSARAVVARIDTEPWVAVCFSAPHVEVRRGDRPARGVRGGGGRLRAELGPDLTVADPNIDAALARLAGADQGRTMADVLLDQRLFCGVGNVFKSEVLAACGIHPDRALGTVDGADRRRLLTTANTQLMANVGGGPRTTVPGGLAVYGRGGQPCRRCQRPIEAGRRGQGAGRPTYWCPRCQPQTGIGPTA
ncbi:MAG: DNA-formamidopyrimidine glycosylase family protein [Actinomycetota bacterium]